MKTYKQFVTEARELDEGLGTISKVAIKGALKLGKKFGPKVYSKSIDPYFAQKAIQKGTHMIGYHGSSAKKIADYAKTGIQPAKSGAGLKLTGANLDWAKRTGFYKKNRTMAEPGKEAFFTTSKDVAKGYQKRGAAYQNKKILQRIKNVFTLGKSKDKGKTVDVLVNKRYVRPTFKRKSIEVLGKVDPKMDARHATEKIANVKAMRIIEPGPSAPIAKDRLKQMNKISPK